MSFVALYNNILSNNITNTLPFPSSNSPKIPPVYQDMYPSVLEEIVFKSISEKPKQEDLNSSLKSKRAISVSTKKRKEKKCLDSLTRIKNSREFAEAFQLSLKSVSCNFSNKDSSASKLANEIYEHIKNHLDANRELELNRFLFLNRFIFNSEEFISSDLVNKYLSVLNRVEKLFWKTQPVNEPEKSKIKTIFSEHLKYNLKEKCKEDEREAIHSSWKQCMIDIFSAFSSLYHTIEECKDFAVNYLNDFRDLLSITPQEKKESIGNTLWSHLQGFIIVNRGQPDTEAKKSLREQLQVQKIGAVSDIINQINITTTQASTSAAISTEFTIQTSESTTSVFVAPTNRIDITNEASTTITQFTVEVVDSVFSVEDETDVDITRFTDQNSTSSEVSTTASSNTTIEDVITNLFTASMNQTDEASTTITQSTVEVVGSVFSAEDEIDEDITTDQSSTSSEDPSTAFLTQSTTTKGTNIFVTSMNQTLVTGESPIQNTTMGGVTSSTNPSKDLNPISTQDTPTENVTVASTSIIATSVGIVSAALSALVGYIFFRKKKSEKDTSRVESHTKESAV